MTSVPACGLDSCPVPVPDDAILSRLHSVVRPSRSVWRRGLRISDPDPTALVPGAGNTRFAPLDDVSHAYLATTTFSALLESALHDAAPPAPRIYEAQLRLWAEQAVRLRHQVRLIDLRDDELARLELDRDELVSTSAVHYPCTRVWAKALHGRSIGGQQTHGLLWHSRQRELHARALTGRPALADLVDEHPSEVAVIWSPPSPRRLLAPAPRGLGPLDEGQGRHYLDDLMALLAIVSQ